MLRLDSQSWMEHFTYLFASSSVQALEQRARGSAQQNLSQQIVADLPVVLPDESVVAKFDSVVVPLFAKWFSNLFQSSTISTLRDTLLPRLLSGELRVPIDVLDEEAVPMPSQPEEVLVQSHF